MHNTNLVNVSRVFASHLQENMDDINVWFAFADHLIDQGDPRGEYIHLLLQRNLQQERQSNQKSVCDTNEAKEKIQKRYEAIFNMEILLDADYQRLRAAFPRGTTLREFGKFITEVKGNIAEMDVIIKVIDENRAYFSLLNNLTITCSPVRSQRWADKRYDCIAHLTSSDCLAEHKINLSISNCGIDDSDLRKMATSNMPYIKHLNLNQNILSAAAVAAMLNSEAGKFKQLKQLQLCNCFTHDQEQVAEIAASLHNIGALFLQHNNISDATAVKIAELENLSSLKCLCISGNNITEHGKAALKNSPHLKKCTIYA